MQAEISGPVRGLGATGRLDVGETMRTIFETSWQRDLWSPRLGQLGPNWLADIFKSGATITESIFESEAEAEKRRAEQARLEAERLRLQTLQQQQTAPEKVLGVSPTTALLVGGLGIAAVIGIIMLMKSK